MTWNYVLILGSKKLIGTKTLYIFTFLSRFVYLPLINSFFDNVTEMGDSLQQWRSRIGCFVQRHCGRSLTRLTSHKWKNMKNHVNCPTLNIIRMFLVFICLPLLLNQIITLIQHELSHAEYSKVNMWPFFLHKIARSQIVD
jgi:hypothetical protein